MTREWIGEPSVAYALFDFDGTLIKGDSIVLFLRFARQKDFATGRDLLRAAFAALLFKLRLLDARSAKQRAMRFLRGREKKEVDRLSRVFVSDVLAPRLRRQGVREMEALRAEGKKILLLSASPDCYLSALRARLPIDGVIATRMDAGQDGVYTGLICGENCRGLQKPLRLAEYLASVGERLDYDRSAAYGDSESDLPMLSLCARRVAVNPKRGLAKKLTGGTTVRWDDPA